MKGVYCCLGTQYDRLMRILLVNKFLYPNGGSETYIFKLGEFLISQGHEVQFFGMEAENNIVGNSVNAYTTNMDFHKSGFHKLLYPLQIIYSKNARRQIRKVIDAFKPDVVHLNNINFQITPSVIYEIKKDKIPIVWTAHDYQLVCPNHMMYRMDTKKPCASCLETGFRKCIQYNCVHGSRIKSIIAAAEGYYYKIRKTYQLVDRIICPSRFIETKLSTKAALRGKTIVLRNFIDATSWKEVTKEEYVLYFGRFSEEKGIVTLVKAAQLMPDIQFIVAGKGPLENIFDTIANIRNIGFITGVNLEELIRKARFSIYPSEWYENCPFSIMESQMYGTPVIGADIGGIPELIQNGRTGLLYQSGDVNDLVFKVRKLWDDKALLHEFEENLHVVTFDSLTQYCEKLIRIYAGED